MTTGWEVYEYEVDMFKGALTPGLSQVGVSFSRYVQNAVAESLMLHTRILVDIILSRDSGPDAISLNTLLPGFSPSRLGELKNLYGKAEIVGSPCWTLNKRLAHATNVRTSRFDYTATMEELRPVIQQCLDEIDGERSKRGLGETRRPEASTGTSFLQSWNMSTSSG